MGESIETGGLVQAILRISQESVGVLFYAGYFPRFWVILGILMVYSM